jgi:hypothetical protein
MRQQCWILESKNHRNVDNTANLLVFPPFRVLFSGPESNIVDYFVLSINFNKKCYLQLCDQFSKMFCHRDARFREPRSSFDGNKNQVYPPVGPEGP